MLNIFFKNSAIVIQNEFTSIELNDVEFVNKLIDTLQNHTDKDHHFFQGLIHVLKCHLDKMIVLQQLNNFSYDWF